MQIIGKKAADTDRKIHTARGKAENGENQRRKIRHRHQQDPQKENSYYREKGWLRLTSQRKSIKALTQKNERRVWR